MADSQQPDWDSGDVMYLGPTQLAPATLWDPTWEPSDEEFEAFLERAFTRLRAEKARRGAANSD
jgi:hypothetical protein